MSKKDKQVSLFNLEGRFVEFIVEDGYKIKRLRINTAEGEYWIKLSKEARASVGGVLSPGDWIQIWGERTVKAETDEVKFKAYRVSRCSPAVQNEVSNSADSSKQRPLASVASPQVAEVSKAKATILVCQKSDCMKRGGKAVCQALETVLSDRGLSNSVTIRGTGCMKQCKAGPNLVMPGKARYSQVTLHQVPTLIEKHFPRNAQPEFVEVSRGANCNTPAIGR